MLCLTSLHNLGLTTWFDSCNILHSEVEEFFRNGNSCLNKWLVQLGLEKLHVSGFEDIMYGNEINSLLTFVVQYLLLFNVMLSPENSLKSLFLNSQILSTLSTNSSSLGEHLTTTCTFGRPCIIWAPLFRVLVDVHHPTVVQALPGQHVGRHLGQLSVNMPVDYQLTSQPTSRQTLK